MSLDIFAYPNNLVALELVSIKFILERTIRSFRSLRAPSRRSERAKVAPARATFVGVRLLVVGAHHGRREHDAACDERVQHVVDGQAHHQDRLGF